MKNLQNNCLNYNLFRSMHREIYIILRNVNAEHFWLFKRFENLSLWSKYSYTTIFYMNIFCSHHLRFKIFYFLFNTCAKEFKKYIYFQNIMVYLYYKKYNHAYYFWAIAESLCNCLLISFSLSLSMVLSQLLYLQNQQKKSWYLGHNLNIWMFYFIFSNFK